MQTIFFRIAKTYFGNPQLLVEKLPKFDLSLYENLVGKEKEETEINLELFQATVEKISTGDQQQCMLENSEDL